MCKQPKINASLAKCINCSEFTFPQRLPTDTGNLILNLIRFYKQFGFFPQQSHHPVLLHVYILFLSSPFSLHSLALAIFLLVNISAREKSGQKRLQKKNMSGRDGVSIIYLQFPREEVGRKNSKVKS